MPCAVGTVVEKVILLILVKWSWGLIVILPYIAGHDLLTAFSSLL